VTEERRRRIDIVQDAEFTASLGELDVAELRRRRAVCSGLDIELSYYRRLLHGRMDLLAFEARRRRGEDERSLLEALPEILAGEGTAGPGFPERRVEVEIPELPDKGRRAIDRVLSDDFLARLPDLTDGELEETQQRLAAVERELSRQRRAVYDAYDLIQAELTRRYAAGGADSDHLLRR
jgi:hypothetical protein